MLSAYLGIYGGNLFSMAALISRTLLIFMPHQKKGGIHESIRLFLETFGWFRLTGLLH